MNTTRRSLLKYMILSGIALTTGCATTLPTNTLSGIREDRISTSEDRIKIQKVGILGNNYFVIPLNTEERTLKYGNPSFALIPENKSRISITQVGEKGGRVIVDAPEGDLYLPYAYSPNGTSFDLDINLSTIKPVRFITSFKISDLKKPDSQNGKIDLETITQEDLSFFKDETLLIARQRYLVNRADDIKKNNVLPIYFTKQPITVEHNRTKEGNIRISGETYLFAKGTSKADYIEQRGTLQTDKEKETRQKETTLRIDPNQK